jgi:hypothetical protein
MLTDPWAGNPSPFSLKGFPWRDFWLSAKLLGPAAHEELTDELIRNQEEAYTPLAAGIRQQIEIAHQDDRLGELLRAALMLREWTAYASHPTKEKAFAIEAIVWDPFATAYHDLHHSIESGTFAIQAHKFAPNSIVRELANKPLFIKRSFGSWLRRPPSMMRRRESAEKIVKDRQDKRGELPMRRADFIKAVMDKLPGLPADGARRL